MAAKKKVVVRDPILDLQFDAVMGIDISLTATGIATVTWGEDGPVWETSRIMSAGHSGDSIEMRGKRLDDIAGEFPALMPGIHGRYLAVIERPTFTSGGSGFDRAYVWWRIARFLAVNGHHVIDVSNSSGKVYTVGRASGPKVEKGEILAQVMRSYPGANIIDDNVADAVGLAAIGANLIGRPVEEVHLPATRSRALKAIRDGLGIS